MFNRFHNFQTTFPSPDPARDQHIHERILGDAYNEEGVMLAWYAYLAEALGFPFTAMVQSHREKNMTYNHQFQLIRMAPLERCGKLQMWAIGKPALMDNFQVHLFISDIYSAEKEPHRIQAIEDWNYWRKRHPSDPIWEL